MNDSEKIKMLKDILFDLIMRYEGKGLTGIDSPEISKAKTLFFILSPELEDDFAMPLFR